MRSAAEDLERFARWIPAAFLGVGFYVIPLFREVVPRVVYHPVTGVWSLTKVSGAIAIGWYGLLIWAVLGILLGRLLGSLGPVRRLLVDPRRAKLTALAAIGVALFAMLCIIGREVKDWML